MLCKTAFQLSDSFWPILVHKVQRLFFVENSVEEAMAEEMSIYLLQATLFDPENIGNKMINNVRHLNNGPLLRTLLCD